MSDIIVNTTETTVDVTETTATVDVTSATDTVLINPPDLAYMHAYDTTIQSVDNVTTSKKIDVNTTSISYQISRSDGTFTFLRSGTYLVSMSIQFQNPATSIVETNIFVKKNNQAVTASSSYSSVPSSHGGIPGRLITMVSFVMQAVTYDTLEFWWHSDNANCKIYTIPSSTNPDSPESPGAIITITQVS